MRVRERACLWMQHHERSVLALGLLGMLGFVVASLGAVSGLLGARTYLVGSAGSLLAYAIALLIGSLGDPFELTRNRSPRRAASIGIAVRSQRVAPSSAEARRGR